MFGLPFLTPTLVKWGGIALAVLAICIYIGALKIEVGHYKQSAIEWEGKYTAYRSAAESNALALKSSNAVLTLQAKQQGIELLKAQAAQKAALIDRITNDKVSANIRIPGSSVRLFNDTTTNPSDIGKPANPVGGHAPDTTPADSNLQQLLLVSASNNSELNSCVDEVEKWNKFWDTFAANVKAVENASRH